MRTGCSGLVFHRCSCCILSWSRTVGVYDKCPFQLTWMLLTHFDKCLFVMMTSDEDGMNKQTRLHGPPPFSLPGSSFFTSLSSCECTGVFDVSRFHAVTEPPVVPLSCFNFAVSANSIHDRTCLPAAHPVARYSLHWVPAGHTQSTCDTEKDNWKNKTSHYLYFFRVKKEMNTGTLRLIAAFQTQ